MANALTLVACGAPLAARTHEVADAATSKGWDVTVVATEAAFAWIDQEVVRGVAGSAPGGFRSPDEPKRGPRPAAVVVCPATFNTVNKLVHGIADTYPLGLLCEALGAGAPTVIVPMVNDRLWGHFGWQANLNRLVDAGVTLVDVRSGDAGACAVPSGTGSEVVARFDPEWVTSALPRL
jgi:hypothetical protein